MTCTFFGHRDVPPELEPVLQAALTQLTERRQVSRFLVGNQGGFDRMALRVLRRLCKTHPGLQVSVVLAYNPGRLPPRAGSPQHEPYAEIQNAGEHHDEHGI